MTASLVAGSFPLYYARDADRLQNGCEAVAESASGLAGNTRLLGEFVSGQISGVTPCAPLCWGSKLAGHDHSGGVMGVPLRRTLWSAVFGVPPQHAAPADANVTSPQNVLTSTFTSVGLFKNRIRCAFIPGGACYRWLEFSASVFSEATVDVTAVITNCGRTLTDTVRMTVGDEVQHIVFDAGKVYCEPGRRQFFDVELYCTRVSSDCYVGLCAVGLHQTSATP